MTNFCLSITFSQLISFFQDWIEVPSNGIYCLQISPEESVKDAKMPESNGGTHLSSEDMDNKKKGSSLVENMDCLMDDNLTVYPWLQKGVSDRDGVSDITGCDIKSVINPELGSLTENYGTYGIHSGILPLNTTVPREDNIHNGSEQSSKTFTNNSIIEKQVHARSNMDSAKVEESIIGTETLLNSANLKQKEVAHELLDALGESVRIRVKAQSDLCAECLQKQLLYSADQVGKKVLTQPSGQGRCTHSRTAVLFSGGIDSLVLAALADRCVALSVVSFWHCMFYVYTLHVIINDSLRHCELR